MAPARAKVSKGLLIEPHYLERSKTRWNPIQSERNDYETFINIDDNTAIESSYESKEAFIPQKPYNSWVLNEDTCIWNAPVARPQDGNRYIWNEETLNWILQTP